MQVKKRLQINVAFSIITAFVVVLMLFLTLSRVHRAVEQSEIVSEILSSAFERSTFKSDYLQRSNERARVQWFAKSEQIGRLLKSASDKFKDPEDKKNIDEMIEDHESTVKLFSDIVENRERTKSGSASAELSQEIENRLVTQLNMRLYDKVLRTRRLREAAEQHLFAALRMAGWSIFFVIAAVAAAATINSWAVGRTIINRIRLLRDGASIIGQGNLDHRIEIKDDDEFAELSKAFNAMTAKLQESYVNLENEIAERKRAEARLTDDVAAMIRLQEISTRFVQRDDPHSLLQAIVDAAIGIAGADMGNLQMYDSATQSLNIVAQHGFERPFLDFFNAVRGDHAGCGTAMKRGSRVIVEDVTQSPIFSDPAMLDVMQTAGVRAVQSTPLVSRTGRFLGMISTHWRAQHRPDEAVLYKIDMLARQAADLIEHSQAEQALRESEAMLARAEKIANAGSWEWDIGRGKLIWSEQTYRIFGVEAGKFIPSYDSFLAHIHHEDRQRVERALDDAVSGTTPYDLEYRIVTLDSSKRWVHARGEVFNENARPIRMIGSVVDITERKRAEEEINELNKELALNVDELKVANKEMEAFIYSIAHDLRAPLRSITGFSDFLLQQYSDKLDDKGKKYLNWVADGGAKMNQIIEDLLHLSRISRHEVHSQDVDMSKTARSIIAELRGNQPDRRVSIDIKEGITACADPGLIEVALSNLLRNAWKFTSKTDNARIEFGTFEREGKSVYYVKDNGAGFDQKFAERLFLPFQRLHSEQEFEGIGIGLATVERVVRRHGGKIWAEGKTNEGAAFFFNLPEERKCRL